MKTLVDEEETNEREDLKRKQIMSAAPKDM